MALITGGMGGLGMLASYEHAMSGRERIVAVTRNAYLTPGEQEAHLLDVIQDIATHYIIRCDIADAGAWNDTLAFASNITAHDDTDPQATMKDAQTLLKEMDSLEVIDVLIASLRGMIEAGSLIDAGKLNRVLFFRNNMSRGLKETVEKIRSMPLDRDVQERLFQFQESLRELSELIELFRKRGLVEERPGATDAGSGVGFFPGEAAAVGTAYIQEAKARDRSASGAPDVAGSSGGMDNGCAAPPGKDALLELMERELRQRSRQPAAQDVAAKLLPGGAAGPVPNLDGMVDVVPGQSPQSKKLGDRPASRRDQPPAAEEQGPEAAPPPQVSHACAGCGKECAMSCSHCSECQRVAERGALQGAIRRAKEEARLKAQRDAERKALREEAERRAREDAATKAEEEAARQARQAAERRAEELAMERAKAEAERRAVEEAARKAQEEAMRQEAERQAREEVDRRSLDDIVCPKGHALEGFVVQAGFPCDLCDVESKDSVVMWGCRNKNERDCRTCDFDICQQCSSSRSRRSLRAQGQAV
mmetsp:Transcript_67672/g.201244  ORF Transcript_67672/g.201244 Transcript_67672/m.201244 type:complete len:535 (+) Transcript_67672:76-1680(+)